ncbi:MAG: hypothetical protein ACR2QW_14295 [bacterium]
MSFEFISSAESVARQQQIWGAAIGIGGLLVIAFATIKGKPAMITLVGIALLAVGGYYLYQSWQLNQNAGSWVIGVNQQEISWQSPDQNIDPSFTLPLGDIAYVDKSAMQSQSDPRNVYHVVLNDESVFKLNDTSGIDLDAFVQYLAATGIEVKSTGKYYEPSELRHK